MARAEIHPNIGGCLSTQICGARGDISAMPDDPPVDHDNTTLADDDIYFYEPSTSRELYLRGLRMFPAVILYFMICMVLPLTNAGIAWVKFTTFTVW